MVLTDVESIGRAKKFLAGAAIVIGVLAFFYGVQTILAFGRYYAALA